MSNRSVLVGHDPHSREMLRPAPLALSKQDQNGRIGTIGRVAETRVIERLLILLNVGHRVLRAGLQGTRSLIAGPATRNGRMRNVTFGRKDLASDADNHTPRKARHA